MATALAAMATATVTVSDLPAETTTTIVVVTGRRRGVRRQWTTIPLRRAGVGRTTTRTVATTGRRPRIRISTAAPTIVLRRRVMAPMAATVESTTGDHIGKYLVFSCSSAASPYHPSLFGRFATTAAPVDPWNRFSRRSPVRSSWSPAAI